MGPLPPPPTASSARYLNRELSWLEFNARVLALAEDPAQPLLERAKFLAIFSQNLDEFFQVRVAGLLDQQAAGLSSRTPDGRLPAQQLLEIRERTEELVERQERAFLAGVAPGLAEAGVRLVHWDELDAAAAKELRAHFDERIFPVLTPLSVDPSHPFPYISNLSLNLAVVVRDPDSGEQRFARVKAPPTLGRYVPLADGERFVAIEEIIAAHLDTLFSGVDILHHAVFRVTRNADLTVEEEEADDLLAAVEMELRRRRFGRAVRLEVSSTMSDEVRRLLTSELDLGDDDVYVTTAPVDLAGLWSIYGVDRPDLKDRAWTPLRPLRLSPETAAPGELFAELARADLLVHHPYDSFAASVESFISAAAEDPHVLAIKMTLYRTSGDTIVNALMAAAESGKQVAVLVELKARFDEQANIRWARRLEEAGVHVVYGLAGLKTHSKCCLVVRDEERGLRRYVHIGTGNYNSATARIYEDVGLLTVDEAVADDVTRLFNVLTGYSRTSEYAKLVVAPERMRPRMLELIRAEAAAPGGRIVFKMNSLVDPAMIDALYEASAAGVEIDLIVRGICCLRPGVPGLSERIRVRSLVGRFLEHSRIYFFANGAGPGAGMYLIGSADLMPRNLDRRIEVLAPVEDPTLQRRLEAILAASLDDDELAWRLDGEGRWRRVDKAPGGSGVNAHEALMAEARRRAGWA
ncbi:MAG: polyphosphate kinase 1 [Acidimicrobiales bacterium]